MFKKMWEEIPTAFKVLWISGAVISAGFTGFIVWAIYKIVTYITATP